MTNIDSLRNIGIIAHIDAGKTTLSERILFYSDKIYRMGEVHDGAATMDFMPEEQERGITITSACTSCLWQGKTINLIDTPGHVDFTIEVERSLRVLDGAIGVFCAVAGVEPQTETVWRQSEKFAVPKMAFINKMDRSGANFEGTLDAMRQRLGANPVPVTIPCGQGDMFEGVLDLIAQEKLLFGKNDQGKTITRPPLDEHETGLLATWREKMLESLAEADDTFLELWMEGKFSRDDILMALRRATIARTLTPVFCGSALRNTGVQPLMDAICDFLPSPADARPAQGTDENGDTRNILPDATDAAIALVFKVIMENGRKISLVRLYAGQLREGDSLFNTTRKQNDRAGRMFHLHADRREQTDCITAGDIAAIVGLQSAHTGDTFCVPGKKLVLEAIDAYAPVISIALEPRNAEDAKVLDEALARYSVEDPTLRTSLDEISGTRMISGMGELHLEVLQERLAREYNIRPRAGQPQVVLRETVLKQAEAEAIFDRDIGKEHHTGQVTVSIAPRPRHAGNHIEVGDFLPKDPAQAKRILPPPLLQAALEGVQDALQCGELSGWPLVDIGVTLTSVLRQEGKTTVPGCHMAASQAVRDAIRKASPITLEPIMRVEISVPEEGLGAAINLFGTAGGKIEEILDEAGQKHVSGSAPLRNLFGFATLLRSATQGRAGLVMTFRHFDRA